MATDDISRSAFYPQKRYSGVRMQQGRILTDDDFNEQDVTNHEDKRLMRKDVIGTAGSPDNGFTISEADDTDSLDFKINAGVFYLGGVRVELHEAQTFKLQKDWLQKPDIASPAGVRQDMVYLEVWQQNVSAVEDEELFESALGGPDTSTRRRTMCRVRLAENIGTKNCAEAWSIVKASIEASSGGQFQENHVLKSDAELSVGYEDNGDGEDLCSPSAIVGYLGAENQSIRVQLTDSNHFTWGFDNGAPLYRVNLEDAGSTRKTIKLLTEPKDQAHWPSAGQIVEIIPWSAVLENGEKLAEELESGHFSSLISSYDPDTNEISLSVSLPLNFGELWESRSDVDQLRKTRFGTEDLENIHGYFFMRVWDRGADQSSDPEIPISNSSIVLGNTGLNVTFSGTHRLPGDHWIISARPHTPDQIHPWQLEVSRGPEGYQRCYAPLSIIHWNEPDTDGHVIYDCRRTFRPLTEQNGCCTFTVGDGVKSHGDFSSIDDAVRHLPAEGGRICVLPGVHRANIRFTNRHNIHFTGCRRQSIIHPLLQHPDEPVFHFVSCQNIRIDDLTLVTHTGAAIMVTDEQRFPQPSTGIHIESNHILALIHAIFVKTENQKAGKNDIRIVNNEIAMLDKQKGDVAIFTAADDVLIDNNRIVVIPAPDADKPEDGQDQDDPAGIIWDPCNDNVGYYLQYTFMIKLVMVVFGYMQKVWFEQQNQHQYLAKGGIQIGGGSELVSINNNQIIGGFGNGITLGSLPDDLIQGQGHGKLYFHHVSGQELKMLREEMPAFLYDIRIENNSITNMGLSGIGVPAFIHNEKIGVMISLEEVLIRENVITHCAQQLPEKRDTEMAMESGFGGIVLAAADNITIAQNRIEYNGNFETQPVCGVLLLYGENVDISNNRIHHNGPFDRKDKTSFEKGLRGGVVVAMSFKQIFYEIFGDQKIKREDGIPAVKVHDNIVTQPLGQALMIITMGPVSVVGNQFTSQGVDWQSSTYSKLAGAVFVLNLGVSQDLMATMLLSSFKYMASRNISMGQAVMPVKETDAPVTSRFGGLLKYLYLPNGSVLYTSNKTTLDLQSPQIDLAFSSQLIVSLDDIAYNNNQSSCQSILDILFTDVALIGVTIRTNDNRFQEGFTITFSSLFSFGLMNTATTNQSTHCLFTYAAPQYHINVGNSVLMPLGCLDKIGMIGRHLAVPPQKKELTQSIINIR